MQGLGIETGWVPTHTSPDDPLPAWEVPDGSRAPVTAVDPGVEFRLIEREHDWARIECANGWTGWVDARSLRPITRAIPPGGLPAWAEPDPSVPASAQADGGLAVRVLASANGWAHVEFANGWTAWVDGRALVVAPARTVSPLPAVGAALMLVGSLLPWATAGGGTISAWDIPAWTLLTHDPSTSAVKVGLFLLIPLLACVPYFTRRAYPPMANVALGSIGTLAAMAGMLLVSSRAGLNPGFGLAAAYLGGVLLTCEYFVTRTARS